MLTRRILPCLDVRDGRVVKGVRFQGLRDAGDPVERAAAYDAQGADELVILDVSATPEGRRTGLDTIRAVRSVLSIPLTVGGGVRTADDAGRLLDAGADKVAVNTAAVTDPSLLTAIATRYGSQCAVLALDAARTAPPAAGAAPGWEVVVQSGRHRTGRDAVAWAREAEARGAGEILLTSWDQDGTRAGYDLPLLGAVASAVAVPVVASGGAATPAHLADALRAGADAVLAASIFHDGEWTVEAIKGELRRLGVEVR
jgi:imidazoleglycerol phosphate synthase cyclase subunit